MSSGHASELSSDGKGLSPKVESSDDATFIMAVSVERGHAHGQPSAEVTEGGVAGAGRRFPAPAAVFLPLTAPGQARASPGLFRVRGARIGDCDPWSKRCPFGPPRVQEWGAGRPTAANAEHLAASPRCGVGDRRPGGRARGSRVHVKVVYFTGSDAGISARYLILGATDAENSYAGHRETRTAPRKRRHGSRLDASSTTRPPKLPRPLALRPPASLWYGIEVKRATGTGGERCRW